MTETAPEDAVPDEAPKHPVQFFFDFSSPYGYLAAQRIGDMASLYGREVDWKPILLGVVFKTTGAQPLLDVPVKGEYSKRDIARMARLMGVPYTTPEVMPFPSIAAARAVYWVKDQDGAQAAALARALYEEAFARGGDIRGAEQVVDVAAGLGIDSDALTAALGEASVKERLKLEVEMAMGAGVCGSPFFIVDGEPFWGADRLDHVERWLATGGW
jgi:2-hydroxychromene-2-carboxylate isomerase